MLLQLRDCCKAKWLFRPGNWVQHLGRPSYWPLRGDEYQPDYASRWKERGRNNQTAGQGNALQLPRHPLAVLAAKDNRDSTSQPQPLRTPSWRGLDDLSHSYPVCPVLPNNYEITEGLVLFPPRLRIRPIPRFRRRPPGPSFAVPELPGSR